MASAPQQRISVVTPSLDQGAFLDQTIASVLKQGYDNLEYIVIDGGSKDNSVEIIRKYADRLAYWASEPDEGQTQAINKGLRRITGDVWAFLASDDTYEPGALQTVANAFTDPDVDVVYGNCHYINTHGIVTRTKRAGPFDRKHLLRNNCIWQPSVFLRRNVLERYGYLDETLRYSMDYEYWIRISGGIRARYVDAVLSNYRLHFESKSMRSVVEMSKEAMDVKHKYGVGWSADARYLWFWLAGARLYHFRRLLFDRIASMRKRKCHAKIGCK
jgi:glycosyltransferase involved in cell wall biosynthesis